MSAPLPNSKSDQSSRPKYEVADTFRHYLPSYLSNHKLSQSQFKMVRAILSCRTAVLGGHKRECDNDDCKHEDQSYNSCGDRHCPKCQGVAKNKWIKKRMGELLPTYYYHMVFTIPHLFNDLVLFNKRLFYDILFQVSSQALKEFAENPKYLGAKIGFIGILHTWGQNLLLHPHIHYIVPGGGIGINDKGEEQWVALPKKDQYLFPKKALSNLFRGKFIGEVKRAYYKGKLLLPDTHSELSDSRLFEMFIDQTVNRRWNVFTKQPFASPADVLLYIGRYTHRVAISNHRIKSIDNEKVSFEYKDYKDKDAKGDVKWKRMSLTAEEFIRRFLLHELPRGYHKIHMYGYLSNYKRKHHLDKVRSLIRASGSLLEFTDEQVKQFIQSVKDYQPDQCPKCQKGTMKTKETIPYIGYVYIEIKDSG